MPVTINGTNGIVFNDATGQSTAGGALKAQNGWQKLPSGLIIQWGQTTVMSGGELRTITFPIAFPVFCANVQTCVIYDGDINEVFPVKNITTTSFQAANSNPQSAAIYWMAIGY